MTPARERQPIRHFLLRYSEAAAGVTRERTSRQICTPPWNRRLCWPRWRPSAAALKLLRAVKPPASLRRVALPPPIGAFGGHKAADSGAFAEKRSHLCDERLHFRDIGIQRGDIR